MLTHPQFDPIVFSLGPLAVRWYGLMYVVGFVAVIVLGKWRVRHGLGNGLTEKDVDDMLIYGVFGVILGGRLGYVLFYKPEHYLDHPAEILQIWAGGMSFHGGFLGVLLGIALFCWMHKQRWITTMDFIAPLVPIGLAAGRIGNFINGELPGRPTDLPWGMWFPQVDREPSRAIPRSSTSSRSRAWRSSPCCGGSRASPGRRARCPARSSSATGRCASSRNSRASPTNSSASSPSTCRWASGSRCP